MASNKIKVAGYAKKLTFIDGIEYTDFTPSLVGLQFTSDGDTPLFTMGNFSITTNLEPKASKIFITNKFSNFVTLTDLSTTLSETQTILTDNATAILNLNKQNLNYYALFGSLTEFVRVALEDIIIKWPASIYMVPYATNSSGNIIQGYTVEDYQYDTLTEISSFKVNVNFIVNRFNINYLSNGTILNTFNQTNELRNMTVNYKSYVVYNNNQEYPVIDFTGATSPTNDYIYLKVKGNPFSGQSNTYFSYHIKPNKTKLDSFFNALPNFEYYLLSRDVTPIYTATFKFPIKSEGGLIIYTSKSITWPVSDGYNIDFDTEDYFQYASNLLEISSNNDLTQSNLMNRFLVSESITMFDTTPVFISETEMDDTGGKVNKTLQIYGVSFDIINNYISGIAFANTVSYNKLDNTPDIYLKNIARVLGWELVSSILENNLLKNYIETANSSYSGQSVGLTPFESDIELWRRLILNSPWLWKSKGTRKGIEFLLKFIGAPKGLVTFNEHIYKAEAPIDIDLFTEILQLNGLSTNLSNYPIDQDGYPKPLPDTQDMYFQGNGLWYRETGGTGSTIDILTGNNPHLGPYDKGSKYINQFKTLIPNFSAVTISSVTTTTDSTNLYTNYDLGTFDEGVSTATTVDTVSVYADDLDLSDCVVFEAKIEVDPNPTQVLNDCGCEVDTPDNVLSLCLSLNPNAVEPICDDNIVAVFQQESLGAFLIQQYQYNPDGSVYTDLNGSPSFTKTFFISTECCSSIGGLPFLIQEYEGSTLINTGYSCCYDGGKCGCKLTCNWSALPTALVLDGNPYIQFQTPQGQNRVVTPDGCHCVASLSAPTPNVTDPYTGQVGVGCQLTALGVTDIQSGSGSEILQYYQDRVNGVIPGV
jgi:hypothetical protein